MVRTAKELRETADALSRNARALREASDAARDRGVILKEMSRTASDAAAKSLVRAVAAEKRLRNRQLRCT
jgi:hypothetical protein